MAIFDFAKPQPSAWHIQNDGVMGGKSSGYMDFSDGMLKFTGEVVMKGGGFTSVLANKDLDLSAYQGVEMQVRGDGRTFEFALDDGTRNRGREVWRRVAFTPTDDWSTIRLSFADLNAKAHGEEVDAPPLNKKNIEAIGFYILDGKNGDFRLEVKEVVGF